MDKKIKCELCDKLFADDSSLSRHISQSHHISKSDYYDKFILKDITEKFCIVCKKPKQFIRITKGYRNKTCGDPVCVDVCKKQSYLEKYGVDSPIKNIDVKTQIKQTNLEKYGVENPSSNDAVQEKRKQTNLEKYGVEYYLSSNDFVYKSKQTNLEKYGVENVFESEEVKYKIKQTNLEKYGVENVFASKEVKEKIKDYNLEKYGVEYFTQTDEFKDKSKQTNLEKYGVYNANQSEITKSKTKQTNLEKYGVEYYFQTSDFKDKYKQTSYEKYGVYFPCQSPEIFDKQQKYRWKKYKLPSGSLINIQGYENFAFDDLLKIYNEEDLTYLRRDLPKLWYIGEDLKKHKYYPDIYIKSKNLIIEVKSEWTFVTQIHKNMIKKQCCIDLGFYFIFMIYDMDGNLIDENNLIKQEGTLNNENN